MTTVPAGHCAPPQDQGDRDVHRPGDQPFDHGDLHRIAGRNLSREIVVDGPGQAGRRDQNRTPAEAQCNLPRPGQDDSAGDDGGGAEEKAAIDIFLEDDPRHGERERAFQVQQQRGFRRRALGEAEQEENRPRDTS
jgi:hypothetical protein